MNSKFDSRRASEFISTFWDQHILASLMDFIRIDNVSRCFDSEWATNGKQELAANHLIA